MFSEFLKVYRKKSIIAFNWQSRQCTWVLKNSRQHTFLNRVTSIVLVFISLSSAGCVSSNFSIETLAKSDINRISDIHIDQTLTLLKTLTRKLYKMKSRGTGYNPGGNDSVQDLRHFHMPCPASGALPFQAEDHPPPYQQALNPN